MTAPELDVEDFVIAYLSGFSIVPSGQIASRIPETWTLPFVLVQRVAGGDDYIVDEATISVHSFHQTQTAASDIARSVNHAMRQLHAKTVVNVDGANWNIYKYITDQTPIFLDWEVSGGGGATAVRYVARYIISVRLPGIQGY